MASKNLGQQVVTLLKDFCVKLQTFNSGSTSTVALPLYLEAIQVMLTNLATSIQQDKDFINLVWQVLCPALIQLLASPSPDSGSRGKPTGLNGFPDSSPRNGRLPNPLLHRIILYPPINQRAEALKVIKEILASPQRLFD